MKKTIYLLLSLFVTTLCLGQSNTLFEQGNTLYNQAKYNEAIAKYEAVLKTQKHAAELYFNLGNAHYKLNNIAPSIYYYEKALQLKPNDKEIQNNIAFARNMTVDAIDVIPEVGFAKLFKNITNLMSFDTWAYATVFSMLCFVLLFLMYYFTYVSSKKRIAFIGGFTFLLLSFVCLFFAYSKFSIDKKNNPAIVFSQEAVVKAEPNLRSEEAFKLHEGTKVQILDTVNNWKKIKLSDGKTGWIPNNAIKALNEI